MNEEPKYRLLNGHIEMLAVSGKWVPSAHDTATIEDIESCEKLKLAVVPFLKLKFFGE